MPQGERTLAERARFKWMLQNINMLYLGAKVLVLLDLSYMSRFWYAPKNGTNPSAPPNARRAHRCERGHTLLCAGGRRSKAVAASRGVEQAGPRCGWGWSEHG